MTFNMAAMLWAAALSLFGGADVDEPARRLESVQVSEPPAPPAQRAPVGLPGDCASWQEVFRHFGATDTEVHFFFVSGSPWGVNRSNIIFGESGCGLRFRNPETSDTGICQINGVHNAWTSAIFGLRVGRSVSEAEASKPEYAAACLYLLRNGGQAGSMKGACNWRPPRFCS